MSELQIFKSTEFGELEILTIDGKEYFPASKCAAILGYAYPKDAIARYCKGAIKHRLPTCGGMQEVKYIPEGDLYRLIVCSKLPKAEEFEHWIFDEVLPTIRKTGGYVANEDMFAEMYLKGIPEEFKNLYKLNLKTINYLNGQVKELNEQISGLNESVKCLTDESAEKDKVIEQKDKVIEQQDTIIEESKPKVEFYDIVSDAKELADMSQFTKTIYEKSGIQMGRNRLFKWLRSEGYLRSNNEPYQQYVTAGYFVVKLLSIAVGDTFQVKPKTFLTGKGQQYILNKLMAFFHVGHATL